LPFEISISIAYALIPAAPAAIIDLQASTTSRSPSRALNQGRHFIILAPTGRFTCRRRAYTRRKFPLPKSDATDIAINSNLIAHFYASHLRRITPRPSRRAMNADSQ
jgi:hypothetical protein